MVRILIVEDEPLFQSLISESLCEEGYEVETASDGLLAANMIEHGSYDLVLLDVQLPKVSGMELLERVKLAKIPAIMITAMSAVEDRVSGLKAGAEDYITKPFAISEMLARVEAVLRRVGKLGSDNADKILTYDEFTIDVHSRKVTSEGKLYDLTPKEFELFVILVRHCGETMFRDVLYREVWGVEFDSSTRTLDLHAQRVRNKLGLGDRLHTVYRAGYRLD